MKNKTTAAVWLLSASLIMLSAMTSAGAEKHKRRTADKNASDASTNTGANTGSSISAKTENGQTKIIYKGKQVFAGPTSGKVSALCSNENGTEYAAAFDGDKMLWENTPGASGHLKK